MLSAHLYRPVEIKDEIVEGFLIQFFNIKCYENQFRVFQPIARGIFN
jgi:hypothetical protein